MDSLCNDVTRHFLDYTNSRVTLAFSTLNERYTKLTCETRYVDRSQRRLVKYAKIAHHYYDSVNYTVMTYLPNGYLHGYVSRNDRKVKFRFGLFHGYVKFGYTHTAHYFQDGVPLSQDDDILQKIKRMKNLDVLEAELVVKTTLDPIEKGRLTKNRFKYEQYREDLAALRNVRENRKKCAGLYPIRMNLYEMEVGYEAWQVYSVRVE